MNQEKIWDEIANQWHDFRQVRFQPVYWFFENYCKNENYCKKKTGKVLDIGCGNARNLLPFALTGLKCYGIDFSQNMIKLAKQYCKKQYCKKHKIKYTLKKADMKQLPFKSNFFDICILPSSLHNIEKNPEKALEEMHRVLKSGGVAFVSVWNKWQPRFFLKKKNLLIPWTKQGKSYPRHYHLYTWFELRSMLRKAGFIILKSKPFSKNLIFVVRK